MSASGERRVEDPDAQVANVVGRVLGAGVVIAVVLVVAGLVVTLVSHPHFVVGPISYHVLVGRRAHFPVGLGGLVRALRHGRGEGIVLLGAVILLATPLAGVVASVIGFATAGVGRMAAVATVVLAILVVAAVVL
ncbi:protein of unknown function DUF1634 [Acidimicrobium ferrooxidans DSM 10331]|uniref:DUF1634 domain-containing protein n=1 Tax=Acidimicrobium ferrooxidans (strain DSM 10331 / JCM 15462 / NBRC 103882 / ICP) TaxID=525909 RepID=C7M0S9_ACIFD|nr:DUF1634 domain-containing protein [Acidimicrobium ferrooxidans]ACU54587.1 protein of unknown function DUF1634 [Acidimicrobium ferrooxidans DSM 10331]